MKIWIWKQIFIKDRKKVKSFIFWFPTAQLLTTTLIFFKNGIVLIFLQNYEWCNKDVKTYLLLIFKQSQVFDLQLTTNGAEKNY